jgi:hypothetical protein
MKDMKEVVRRMIYLWGYDDCEMILDILEKTSQAKNEDLVLAQDTFEDLLSSSTSGTDMEGLTTTGKKSIMEESWVRDIVCEMRAQCLELQKANKT